MFQTTNQSIYSKYLSVVDDMIYHDISSIYSNWLVVWTLFYIVLITWNILVSWDDDIPNVWKVKKNMFQTTNQLWFSITTIYPHFEKWQISPAANPRVRSILGQLPDPRVDMVSRWTPVDEKPSENAASTMKHVGKWCFDHELWWFHSMYSFMIAKLANITPISLGFMAIFTIVNGFINQQTSLGWLNLYQRNKHGGFVQNLKIYPVSTWWINIWHISTRFKVASLNGEDHEKSTRWSTPGNDRPVSTPVQGCPFCVLKTIALTSPGMVGRNMEVRYSKTVSFLRYS